MNRVGQGFPAIVSEVNVMTGRAGWFKRINQDKSKVARRATLTDETSIDQTGQASDRIFQAAKREVIHKITPTVEAPMAMAVRGSSGSSGSKDQYQPTTIIIIIIIHYSYSYCYCLFAYPILVVLVLYSF